MAPAQDISSSAPSQPCVPGSADSTWIHTSSLDARIDSTQDHAHMAPIDQLLDTDETRSSAEAEAAPVEPTPSPVPEKKKTRVSVLYDLQASL